jgi:hypothetical protein
MKRLQDRNRMEIGGFVKPADVLAFNFHLTFAFSFSKNSVIHKKHLNKYGSRR